MSDEAFAAVLREHADMPARIAAIYEARSVQRDDLLQDIAVALWRALPSWREEASLKTFAARVAHNRGVDYVIQQRRQGQWIELSPDLPDAGPSPESEALQAQSQAHLFAAIRRLPLSHQQVLSLALEGFPHAEIASALGISVNNVDVRLTRARQGLKKMLGDEM